MFKRKMYKKQCSFCKKELNLEGKHILLGTYDGELTLQEDYFHMVCFRQWYNQKVTEKAVNTNKAINGLMGSVRSMMGNMPELQGFLGRETQVVDLDQEIPQLWNKEEKKKKKVKKKN